MGKTVPVYTTLDGRYLTDFWGLLGQELPVTDTHRIALERSMDRRVGVLNGRLLSTPTSGNDRRWLLLDPTFTAEDVEVHLTYENFGGSPVLQGGVAVRAQPGGIGWVTPTIWQNVFFGTTGTLIPGAWEFTGVHGFSGGFQTNQQADQAGYHGFPRAIASITANGSLATVTCSERHYLAETNNTGVGVVGNALFPTNPFVGATVLDPFTFTFPTTVSGGPTAGGVIQWLFWAGRRTLAVRLVGSEIRGKQWPTDIAPEPSWDDPVKVGTTTFPGTLIGGTPFPSGPGRVGLLFAHADVTGVMRVYQFEVRSLD